MCKKKKKVLKSYISHLYVTNEKNRYSDDFTCEDNMLQCGYC